MSTHRFLRCSFLFAAVLAVGILSLPREVLSKTPTGGFRAFAVDDDLTKAPAPATINVAKPAVPEKVAAIDLKIPAGADVTAAWEKYFATQKPSAAAVRETARVLREKHKFDEIIAMIWGALRHDQAQPWMYEALTLAMQLGNRPREEIERAVMSAADFADSPLDLMYLAAYLADNKMHARALKLFRQVSMLRPLAPEPYLFGLKSAQALNDLDGVRWATVGILSQAWPKDQRAVWTAAQRVANATLESLKAANRVQDAAQFKKALDDAMIRDLVVEIKWSGDADVDVFVEEPAGTVCSARLARTTSGGVFIGDTTSVQGRQELAEGASEIYVCPQAFSGDYRVLVRRVWGTVVTNAITMRLYRHYRSHKELINEQKIALDKGEAVVKFEFKDGRRRQSLTEQQVANAAAGQIAVNQQVLGQQLAAAVDAEALAALLLARAATDLTGAGGGTTIGDGTGTSLVPFPIVRGAVGYQPIIITLPEGTNFMATGVVSADRRYVRVTCVPLISAVSNVSTFSTATGFSGTSGGGTGGAGFSGF